jgi:Domain of unknown function (DUF4352)
MGQRSPDGRYYWDGSAWRPVVTTPADRPRRWPWLLATAAALGVLLAVCTAAASVSSGGGRPATQAERSPAAATCAAPCASVGGWTVTVSNLRYGVASGSAFQRPEAGNVFVTVEVSFVNRTSAEQHVDPFQFVLQDGAGVKHSITWIEACPAWAGVNLRPNATFGPRRLAFQAVAGRPDGLTLVWTPGLFAGDHPIKLT